MVGEPVPRIRFVGQPALLTESTDRRVANRLLEPVQHLLNLGRFQWTAPVGDERFEHGHADQERPKVSMCERVQQWERDLELPGTSKLGT